MPNRKIFALIDEQIALGKEGYVGFKCNSITSKNMIEKLIEASKAGVKIDLIVRGICCIIPGIKDETENIFKGGIFRRTYVDSIDNGYEFITASEMMKSDISGGKFISKKY